MGQSFLLTQWLKFDKIVRHLVPHFPFLSNCSFPQVGSCCFKRHTSCLARLMYCSPKIYFLEFPAGLCYGLGLWTCWRNYSCTLSLFKSYWFLKWFGKSVLCVFRMECFPSIMLASWYKGFWYLSIKLNNCGTNNQVTFLRISFFFFHRRYREKKEEVAEPEVDPERDQRTVFAYQVMQLDN